MDLRFIEVGKKQFKPKDVEMINPTDRFGDRFPRETSKIAVYDFHHGQLMGTISWGSSYKFFPATGANFLDSVDLSAIADHLNSLNLPFVGILRGFTVA